LEIDMTSLSNKDVSDAGMNAKLVGHLKSDDFFSVEKHPVSSLKITKVEKKAGKTMITGDLTIKGITKPVTFPADVKVEKNSVKAKGEVKVDRTNYDIKFRSVKFFSDIGDKVINDEFKVGFDISASK
jgi:polyisoprenoid-binding protein YceI